MFKEAIMILTMTAGAGNSTFGSESVTSFPSMETCKAAMRVFRSTKGSQYRVVNGENSVRFTEDVDWDADRHYSMKCIPLSDGE